MSGNVQRGDQTEWSKDVETAQRDGAKKTNRGWSMHSPSSSCSSSSSSFIFILIFRYVMVTPPMSSVMLFLRLRHVSVLLKIVCLFPAASACWYKHMEEVVEVCVCVCLIQSTSLYHTFLEGAASGKGGWGARGGVLPCSFSYSDAEWEKWSESLSLTINTDSHSCKTHFRKQMETGRTDGASWSLNHKPLTPGRWRTGFWDVIKRIYELNDEGKLPAEAQMQRRDFRF